MIEGVANKRGEVIRLGDILFMESPASKQWPRTFPEASWMFIVKSLNSGRLQGCSVNWKRKGKGTWVSRQPDELGMNYDSSDGMFHGLRRATENEIKYFLKRAPEYKKFYEECEALKEESK